MSDLSEQDVQALRDQWWCARSTTDVLDAMEEAVEAIVARHRAEAWDEGRWAEREYMKQVMAYHHWSNISAGPPVDPPNPHLDRAAQIGASGG